MRNVQRDCGLLALQLLAERIAEPGEAALLYPED